MLINVPQYIDVEDKVAGPITAKQLGWLILLGIILFLMWTIIPGVAFFVMAIPVSLLFIALAFFKPYGQPLGNFILFGVMYFFRPKVYVWKRTAEKIPVPQHVAKKQESKPIADSRHVNKEVALKNLEGLAKILDSSGAEKDERILEILKKREIKK